MYYQCADGSLATPPWVYFIQCEKFVKIGTTFGDPALRVRGVRTHCPFPANLIAVIAGGRAGEHRWHLRFEDELERGEWFRLTPRLKNAILDLRPKMVAFPDRTRPMLTKAKQRAQRRTRFDENGEFVTRITTAAATEPRGVKLAMKNPN